MKKIKTKQRFFAIFRWYLNTIQVLKARIGLKLACMMMSDFNDDDREDDDDDVNKEGDDGGDSGMTQ